MLVRLRWMTAGESHGKGVLSVLEGIPAGFTPDMAAIDRELVRRQGGYGRGKRMAIESDTIEVLSGLKRGVTLGSPLTLLVRNKDHRIDSYRRLARPRPGHADLAGVLKYGQDDCGDVMERASARETAARVAAGALATQVLAKLGIELFSWVTRIGEVALRSRGGEDRASVREASDLYSLDPEGDARARELVDRVTAAGDSVGGCFRVEASGAPPGLGSHIQWDRRLDGRIAQALMSIQGMKAVEIGAGVTSAEIPGSLLHDPILPVPGGFRRPSNNAGGIEGGMTNGEPVLATVTMKPIPSLRKPLASVDLDSGLAEDAVCERSDVCSVPAASVVGESMLALVMLDALLEKVGGDSLREVAHSLAHCRRGRNDGEGFSPGGHK